jgi:sarcosine oxidase
VTRFMEGLVAPRLGRPRTTTTCLSTMTADRDFVLDRRPDHPQVLVALGAAHGFKFASWFGRVVAELTLDVAISDDITPFALTRPGLRRPVAREVWLV